MKWDIRTGADFGKVSDDWCAEVALFLWCHIIDVAKIILCCFSFTGGGQGSAQTTEESDSERPR